MNGFLVPGIIRAAGNDANMKSDHSKGAGICSFLEYRDNKYIELFLDFGIKTTGYFFIELEESSDGIINIAYGPKKEAIFFRKEIRMPVAGELWVDDDYLALRYMKLTLKSRSTLPGACCAKIKRVGLKFSAYPCIYKGSFECEDRLLNDIWKVGAYTTQLCIQKSKHASVYKDRLTKGQASFIRDWKGKYSQYLIFDGPRRDREAWIGDIRTEALNVYTSTGAYDVVKSSLEVFYDLQDSSGLVPGCAATWQDFKEYNLWWIISIWECYLFSGDKEFLQYIYPGFRSLMDWIMFNLDNRGFIYNSKTWMWTFPREGYSAATQCILYHALKCAEKIEIELENHEAAWECGQISGKIKNNIINEFWDEEKGIFFDRLNFSNLERVVLSDVNCNAVVFGIAGDKAKRILKYLREEMWTRFGSTTIDKKITAAVLKPGCTHYNSYLDGIAPKEEDLLELMWPHNKQIWPFINAYEVEANFRAGNVHEALELIRRCWGSMLNDNETGTFWEMAEGETGKFPIKPLFKFSKDDTLNSACHGWSGWISYIMQAYILGVTPAKPGFKEVVISPNPGELVDISGKVPTPHGAVQVHIINNKNLLELEVKKPENVTITYNFDRGMRAKKEIKVKCNGAIINVPE